MATHTTTQHQTETENAPPSRPEMQDGPTFPDDVPIAPLLRLSLAKLQSHNPDELARLARACEDLGFFYLDLAGPGGNLLRYANQLFDVGVELYDLPLAEKKKYDFASKKSYFGYKGYGAGIVDREGNADRNEFYNVSKGDIMGISDKLPAPSCLERKRDLLRQFMTEAHTLIIFILGLLNDYLGLPANTLQDLHRLSGASGDQVRFLKAPPQPADDRRTALGEHTDFGSVTVLFNRLGGLQILPPGKNAEWCYVKPLTGHAVINLGDAMVKFTNGLFRSNIHRVVPPPGQQASHARYSLVYFSRPEDEVLLRRLDGSSKIPPLKKGEVEEVCNSRDWVIRRAMAIREGVKGKGAVNWSAVQGTEQQSRRDE